MKTYELINPSDPYTMQADDFATAVAAALALGNGAFGLESIDSDESMPIFLLSDPDEWLRKQFGVGNLGEFLNGVDLDEIAGCLDTVLIGNAEDRKLYEFATAKLADTPDKAAEFAAEWHDRRRSSMNDIGARAKIIADNIRRRYTEEGDAE